MAPVTRQPLNNSQLWGSNAQNKTRAATVLNNTQNNKEKLSCNPSYHTARGYITSAGTAKSNHGWSIVSCKQIVIKVVDFAAATCFHSGEQELKKNNQKHKCKNSELQRIVEKTSKCPQREEHSESASLLF